jgi:MFS family permease
MWLDIGRLSTGFAVGLLSYVIPVYIAEITPKHARDCLQREVSFSLAPDLLCRKP